MRRETTFCDFCRKEITEETKAKFPKLDQMVIRTGDGEFQATPFRDICQPCNSRMNGLIIELGKPEVRVR